MRRSLLIGLAIVAAAGAWVAVNTWRRSADRQLALAVRGCEFPAAFPCLDQILRLELPIAGTGFSLAYASDRTSIASGTAARPATADGLGGWSLSVLRYFDPAGGVLMDAAEGPRLVHPVRPATGAEAGHLLVAEPSGLRALVFDDKGRHLRTLDALTAATIAAFDYDAAGRLSAVTTRSGVTRIERSADGSVITIVAPAGWRTGLRLGPQGRLARVSEAGGGHILLETDGQGLLRSLTNQVSGRWSYDYDPEGRLAAIHDPSSGVTTFARTVSGARERLEVTSPLGRTTVQETEIASDGRYRRSLRDPSGSETVVERDSAGHVKVTDQDGTVRTDRWDADPRWGADAPVLAEREIRTPGGVSQRLTSSRTAQLRDRGDPLSLIRLVGATDSAGRHSERAYDAASRAVTATSPAGLATRIVLDAAGRIVRVERPDRPAAQYRYDDRGRLVGATRGTGADARVSRLIYHDTEGSVTFEDASGGHATAQFGSAGQPVWWTTSDDEVVSAFTDAAGRLARLQPPGRPPYAFGRTSAGLLESVGPPRAWNAQSFSYDPDGAPAQLGFANSGTVVFERDMAGRVVAIRDGSSETRVTYDAKSGRPLTFDGPGAAHLALMWDAGEVVDEQLSGSVRGRVQRVLGADRRLTRETVAGTDAIDYEYDPDGRLTRAGDLRIAYDRATGLASGAMLRSIRWRWERNAHGEIVRATVDAGGRTVYSESLDRDRLGRIVARRETGDGIKSAIAYRYDDAGAIAAVEGGEEDAKYAYDPNGNRTARTSGRGAVPAAFDDRDRVTSAGSIAYVNDAAGRVVEARAGERITRFAWSPSGRLEAVTRPDGHRIEYGADGFGRRVAKTVNGRLERGWLYADRLRPIAELAADGAVVSRFVYAGTGSAPGYMLRDGKRFAILTDEGESVRLVVDAESGVVAQRIDYDVFGRIVRDTNPGFQPFGFAGGLVDADTGLVHFGAREYDPDLGRWLTPDPQGFSSGDTNLYRYALGDPVNRRDPTGLGPGEGGGPGGCCPWTYGVTVGGIGALGNSAAGVGLNLQHIPGHGWALYRFDSPDESGGGLAAGVGISANLGIREGMTPPPGGEASTWEGPFDSYGGGVSWFGADWYKSPSDPDNPGTRYEGFDVGVGAGAPAGGYKVRTEYTCIIGCGSSNGDPHMLSPDGLHYEFQAAGEFTLLESPSRDLVVQARHEPVGKRRDVTLNTAVAVKAGPDRVGFYLGAAGGPLDLKVNGRSMELTKQALPLDAGGRLERVDAGGYLVSWPDGSRVVVRVYHAGAIDLTVDLAAARRGAVRGLLGNFDGDRSNDLVMRDGKRITLPERRDPAYRQVVYGAFAESWRVSQADSLFDYAPGTDTRSFVDRSIPDQVATVEGLPNTDRARAEAVCGATGVRDPSFFDDCVLDVALTGQPGFAAATIAAEASTVPPPHVEEFHLALGDAIGPGRPAPGAGEIARADEMDRFTFQAQGGDVVAMTALSPCDNSKLTWRLVGPDSNAVPNEAGDRRGSACSDRGRFVLPAGGTYAVEVGGDSAGTGHYSFRLVPVQDADIALQIGAEVSRDHPRSGAGWIAAPNEVDRYRLDLTAGQTVYIATRGCEMPYAVWRLLDPANRQLVGYYQTVCVDLGRFTAKEPGTYTIAVSADRPSGSHAFHVLSVPPDDRFTISLGESIAPDKPAKGAGRIEVAGAADEYTFDAAAGGRVVVTPGEKGSCDLRWAVRGPDGTPLVTNQMMCVARPVTIDIRRSGPHSLVVSGWQSTTGTYSLRLSRQ